MDWWRDHNSSSLAREPLSTFRVGPRRWGELSSNPSSVASHAGIMVESEFGRRWGPTFRKLNASNNNKSYN